MSKVTCIGIIAEDDSDFHTARILIKRIVAKNNLSFKTMVGHGCGKLKSKASVFAENLYKRGCDMLILIHDCDKNNCRKLLKDLEDKIKSAPFEKKMVCIPIEELEAWFLSDPEAIKKTFTLKRLPRFNGLPETIASPKEKLGEQIFLCSDKLTIFLHTTHNENIAANINLTMIQQKCPSFKLLHDFVLKYEYR